LHASNPTGTVRFPVDPALRPDDLAPGDRVVAARDWSDLRVHRVRDAADPDFALAYERLWSEFGGRGEMERRRVIEERLAWDPAKPVGSAALAYELLVLRRGGALAALRDHTAVVRLDAARRPLPGPVVVHLSHAFVVPEQRGGGIAAWLRALPLETARRCARAAAADPAAEVVLVAEMEPPGPQGMARLRSYERAGFQKVDPAAAPYAQPDFRPAELLAGETPQPIPLSLVLRRVGREHEARMAAAELAAVVAAIYAVYAVHVPAAALEPLREDAAVWTAREASFRLLPPTA
jgi:GNAT superfamily N-acetyltransferase